MPLGVGGIEAEAVMLGQSISMVLPEVIGYKLFGVIDPLVTSTDVVLTITKVNQWWQYIVEPLHCEVDLYTKPTLGIPESVLIIEVSWL